MTETTMAPPIATSVVREWAERRHLIEPGTRGRLPAQIHAAYANEQALIADTPRTFEGTEDTPPAPMHVPVREVPAPEPARAETAPGAPPKERTADKVRRAWGKTKTEEPKPDTSRRPRKRVSLETLGGLAWVGVSKLAVMAGETYLPVAKMMSFQAPVAGAVVEDLARGTIVDRIAQPIARIAESGGAAGALIGAPLLTGVVCRNPELYPRVKPMLMSCMREWVIIAGPKLREMRRREEKFAAEMGTFTEEFGVTVDELLDEVFASMTVPAQPGPMAAEQNGQHA